jgi:hypothetical protein
LKVAWQHPTHVEALRPMSLPRIAILSFLPSLGASVGAAVDESRSLGFSTWRSACRADGVSFGSVLSFTWQLLPNAIIGFLSGGLMILILGIARQERDDSKTESVAAHAGCMLAMPLGLLACAQLLPAIVMPVADVLLSTAGAIFVLWLLGSRPSRHCARQ